MAVLSAKQRARSAVIHTKRRTKTGKVATEHKFPIPDVGHAKAALARINQAKPPLTSAQKAKVRARAYQVLGKKPKRGVK